MFKMLRNQMADFHKKIVLPTIDITFVSEEQLGISQHPKFSFKELYQLYQRCLDGMPEKRHEVFLMSTEQHLSHQRITELQDNLDLQTPSK